MTHWVSTLSSSGKKSETECADCAGRAPENKPARQSHAGGRIDTQ
jgi:hypothetical protein